MFKKTVKEWNNQKVLFYYRQQSNFFEVISITKHQGKDHYTCWMVDICSSDIDLIKIEDSLNEIIHQSYQYTDEGWSICSSLDDLTDEVKDYIPNLVHDVRAIDSELLVV